MTTEPLPVTGGMQTSGEDATEDTLLRSMAVTDRICVMRADWRPQDAVTIPVAPVAKSTIVPDQGHARGRPER